MTLWKRNAAVVAVLLGLSGLVQAWLIHHAAVPGQDAVRFVRIAQKIDRQGLLPTLKNEGQQPLFPVTVWIVSRGLACTVGPSPSAWATSVQLAAAVPLVLAVVPVYFVALRLVGPRGAAAGGMLFCVLPEVARLGADGLSDSTHLLLFALALWAVVEALTGERRAARDKGNGVRGSGSEVQGSGLRVQGVGPKSHRYALFLWLALAGGLTAAAALTRVETMVLPAALAVATVGFQLARRWRRPWRRVAVAAGCYGLGFAMVFGPYLAATGSSTPRAAIARALGKFPSDGTRPSVPAAAMNKAAWQLDDGRPMSFAYKEPSVSRRWRGYRAATVLLAEELPQAFGYWVGPLALVGLWQLRRTPPRREDRFAQAVFLLFCLGAIHHAAGEGYLSARHLLPLVVVGIGCGGHGLIAFARSIAKAVVGGQPEATTRSAATRAVAALAVAACLAPQLEPLHAARRPHRSAGRWLASEAEVSGAVLDTRGWTGLYSGRPTYGYQDAWQAFCDPRLAYVVIERWELDYQSDRSRTLKALLARAAEPVASFCDSPAGASGHGVMVYRWNGEQFYQWLAAVDHPNPETSRCNLPCKRL